MFGYFCLIQAANMPPYEPPNTITGLLAVSGYFALMYVSSTAKSASACSDDR